jgi:drug/metabolite transporter (DMT)-like permease
MNWLLYALLTVACWGVYGIFLHTGTLGMGDPANGRLKAFLLVGVAYFLTAVLAPIAILMAKGADVSFWHYPSKGLWWSLVAGIVGAVGALGVLLAFGVGGKPAVVMSIIFAGAPIVNAVVAILQHPPAGGWGAIKPQFFLGIVLAAVGAGMVMYFKPNPAPAKPTTASVQSVTLPQANAR